MIFHKKLYIIDMSRRRKYQKVIGHWVYGHLTPDYQFIYFGRSDQAECCRRWLPSAYKTTELQPFIEQYGWDNLIHIVIQDGLTKEQAKKLEGILIKQGKIDGWCINKNNNVPHYDLEYYREKHKQYREANKEKHQEYCKQYYKEYKEEHKDKLREYRKQYYKQVLSTPEGKIYNRVAAFNRKHIPIETPLEAKNKYLEYGYIPSYIKNDDLV